MKIFFPVLAAVLLPLSSAHAVSLYYETFGNTTDQANVTTVGWSAFTGATAAIPTTPNLSLANGPGRPADQSNVNAGPIVSSTAGYVFMGSGTAGNAFVFTDEYTIDRTSFEPTSFSIHSGNGAVGAASAYRFTIRIDGNWYATDSTFGNAAAVSTGANFATQAQQVSFTFDTAATTWRQLTFTPGSTLSLASGTLAAPLPAGNITAFGIYSGASGSSTRRFDSYAIEGIPEPATAAILLAGAAVLTTVGRRRVSVS